FVAAPEAQSPAASGASTVQGAPAAQEPKLAPTQIQNLNIAQTAEAVARSLQGEVIGRFQLSPALAFTTEQALLPRGASSAEDYGLDVGGTLGAKVAVGNRIGTPLAALNLHLGPEEAPATLAASGLGAYGSLTLDENGVTAQLIGAYSTKLNERL